MMRAIWRGGSKPDAADAGIVDETEASGMLDHCLGLYAGLLRSSHSRAPPKAANTKSITNQKYGFRVRFTAPRNDAMVNDGAE
jgi:hypothetical protein